MRVVICVCAQLAVPFFVPCAQRTYLKTDVFGLPQPHPELGLPPVVIVHRAQHLGNRTQRGPVVLLLFFFLLPFLLQETLGFLDQPLLFLFLLAAALLVGIRVVVTLCMGGVGVVWVWVGGLVGWCWSSQTTLPCASPSCVSFLSSSCPSSGPCPCCCASSLWVGGGLVGW